MPTLQVLFFSPENPFSNRAGNTTRAKKNISILKKLGCNIDLVGFKNIYDCMDDELDYDHKLVENHFLIAKKPLKSLTSRTYWKYKWLKLFGKKNRHNPLLTLYAKDSFENILKKKKYDYIIINYEIWSDLIHSKLSKNTINIVDTHDWMTLNEFYQNPKLDFGRRFYEEINNLNKFDKVITISQDETFVFKSFLGEKVINIPPSFAVSHSTTKEKKWDLIFVGSENIFNRKSLEWFFENVYPLLGTSIRILIIGRVSKYISVPKTVETIYFAENLSCYYHQSKIAICPILEGTGIKIKAVEALSFGIPVVGTTHSIDGFSSKIDNGCLIDDEPAGFKNHILKLLENENYYNTIKTQAEQYFTKHFSEESGINKWKQVLGL